MREASAVGGKVTFIRMASRPVPRVTRMMQVFADSGFEPVFVGAFREEGLPAEDSWEGWRVLRVGPWFPLLNGRRFWFYLKSVFGFSRALYSKLKELRPGIVHVSDFDAAASALLYGWRHGVPVIYNIHDNLAQRYRVPQFVAGGLNVLEGLAVRGSRIALVPEAFRRAALPAWSRKNVAVVRNTPIDPGYSDPAEMGDEARRRILYAGWLDWGRGLRELMQLVDANPALSLAVAGEGDAEVRASAQERERVQWLGFLDHRQVIDATRSSGFVAALYDPARPINRYAASNKIAEGLAVGRPIVVNSELEIAKSLRGYGCLVEAPYGDVAALNGRLQAVIDDARVYDAMSRAARRAYEELFDWTVVRSEIEKIVRVATEGQAR